jgi:phage terminase large subunit
MRVVRSHVPVAFEPLLKAARYKGAYGGRGGAKSHFFADRLVLKALAQPIRAVCIRELQLSLKDSSRQLIVDKIQGHNVGDRFEVLDAEIRGNNGSLVIFRGMQSYNAESIKSLEGYDIAWIEEAQTLSEKSLELLRPTLRKEGSEIWASWNPRHRTDPVDVFFRKNPPPDAVSVNVNWRDNPWFPEVLRKEREHDMATDPEMAEHVWEGGYGVSHGAILARQVDAADRAGRINDRVELDPEGPGIEITSDLGFRDTACWWFWQRRIGGYSLLDFDGDSGLDAGEWCERLKTRVTERGWALAKIWLPHDARTKTFQSRHSAIEQFAKAFGADKVAIVPKTSKLDRINAARTVVQRCEFHRERCAQGLEGLRAWEFEYNYETQTYSREPAHNWASHPADAFSYGCQVMEGLAAPTAAAELPKIRGMSEVTLEELFEDEERQRRQWVSAWI